MLLIYILVSIGCILIVSGLFQLSFDCIANTFDRETVLKLNCFLYKISVYSLGVLITTVTLLTIGCVVCVIE